MKKPPLTVLDLFESYKEKSLSKVERRALKKKLLKEKKKQAKADKKKSPKEKLKEEDKLHNLISDYIKDNIDGNKLVANDMRVDDSEFPLAKNVVEFWTDRRFSTAFAPVAKQIEVGINYLTDYCPRCSDVDYAKAIPTRHRIKRILKKVTMLEYGKCPKCGITRTKIWKKGLLPRYTEAALLVGQRGFKSSTTAILNAYLVHRLLKLQSPAEAYGLPSYTTLAFTFTALTFVQAKNLIYREFYNFIDQSPWFQAYHKMLKQYERETGEEIFKFSDTLFHYRHRGIMGHVAAPSLTTSRGYTRVSAVIDELGWFTFNKENAVRVNAQETYNALKRSLLTIRGAARRLHKRGFYDIPAPMFTNISSPSNVRDKICQLVEQSKKEGSEIFSRHYSTFEFNPYLSPEDLKEEMEDDYVAYKRDYLAIPPMAANPFIDKRRTLKSCVDLELPNLVEVKQVVNETRSGDLLLTAEYEINEDHPFYDHPKVLALDAGFTNNSFAAALLAADEDEDGNLIKIVTSAFEIIPHDGMRIDHSALYSELLWPLAEELNVKFVYADRWNSIKILQDFMNDSDEEIVSMQYSPTYSDFMTWRNEASKCSLVFPQMELSIKKGLNLSSKSYPKSMIGYPITHFVVQTLGANNVMGKKIDKGDRLTDDLLRAIVLGCTAVDLNDNKKTLLDSYGKQATQTRTPGIVVSVGSSFITGGRGGGVSSGMAGRSAFASGSYGKPMGF